MNTVLADKPNLPKPDDSIPFQIVSEFTPAGDQPQAIAKLLDGIAKAEKDQVLLGIRQDLHHGPRHPVDRPANYRASP